MKKGYPEYRDDQPRGDDGRWSGGGRARGLLRSWFPKWDGRLYRGGGKAAFSGQPYYYFAFDRASAEFYSGLAQHSYDPNAHNILELDDYRLDNPLIVYGAHWGSGGHSKGDPIDPALAKAIEDAGFDYIDATTVPRPPGWLKNEWDKGTLRHDAFMRVKQSGKYDGIILLDKRPGGKDLNWEGTEVVLFDAKQFKKGYPEFDPDQHRNPDGTWGGGGGNDSRWANILQRDQIAGKRDATDTDYILYMGSGTSVLINRTLREGKNLDDNHASIAKSLDNLIAAHKTTADGIVWRGVAADAVKGIKPGDVLGNAGFTSTTMREEWATRVPLMASEDAQLSGDRARARANLVLMEIFIPKGTNVGPGTDREEAEVVLPRGTRLRYEGETEPYYRERRRSGLRPIHVAKHRFSVVPAAVAKSAKPRDYAFALAVKLHSMRDDPAAALTYLAGLSPTAFYGAGDYKAALSDVIAIARQLRELRKYRPDQLRDARGRFAREGAGDAPKSPAAALQGVRTAADKVLGGVPAKDVAGAVKQSTGGALQHMRDHLDAWWQNSDEATRYEVIQFVVQAAVVIGILAYLYMGGPLPRVPSHDPILDWLRNLFGKSMAKGYPEFDPDQPRDEGGRFAGGSVGDGRPREFFRGTNPGDTRRIKTERADWDAHLFAADSAKGASWYGSQIERITAKPEARILYEGTREFRSLAKGLGKLNLLEQSAEIANRAKASGWDAVWFKRQTDVGTVILNRSKFDFHGPITKGYPEFDPDQPRDEGGRFSGTSGGGSVSALNADSIHLTKSAGWADVIGDMRSWIGNRWSTLVNERLRAGEVRDEIDRHIVGVVDTFIAAHKATRDSVVYRGVAGDYVHELQTLPVGALVHFKSFSSTTARLEWAEDIARQRAAQTSSASGVMEINLPSGINVGPVFMHKFRGAKHEMEVILPRNITMRYDGRGEAGRYVFTVLRDKS